MTTHKSNKQLMQKRDRDGNLTLDEYAESIADQFATALEDGNLGLHTLDEYAESIADQFATALEDGFTLTEIRLAVFAKLEKWEVEYE